MIFHVFACARYVIEKTIFQSAGSVCIERNYRLNFLFMKPYSLADRLRPQERSSYTGQGALPLAGFRGRAPDRSLGQSPKRGLGQSPNSSLLFQEFLCNVVEPVGILVMWQHPRLLENSKHPLRTKSLQNIHILNGIKPVPFSPDRQNRNMKLPETIQNACLKIP